MIEYQIQEKQNISNENKKLKRDYKTLKNLEKNYVLENSAIIGKQENL